MEDWPAPSSVLVTLHEPTTPANTPTTAEYVLVNELCGSYTGTYLHFIWRLGGFSFFLSFTSFCHFPSGAGGHFYSWEYLITPRVYFLYLLSLLPADSV